jgi:hypothetical protein
LLVHPWSEGAGTRARFIHEPFFALPDGATDRDLGERIISALEASRTGAQWPSQEELSSSERRQWAAVGTRSRRDFANGTLLVNAQAASDGTLELTPTTFRGPPVGWRPLADRTMVASEAEPEALGKLVREALAMCN